MKIILASQSPRRKFLIEQLGLEFECIPSGFTEIFDENRDAAVVAEEIGLGKALEVAQKRPEAIVIGGDTLVSFQGKQIGKAKNAEDERNTLRSYRNRSCSVISSVAVIYKDKGVQTVLSDTAEVHFDDLDEEAIDNYLVTGNFKDKGGSFAVQHPLIRDHITKIVGRLDTIIGLPTLKLSQILEDIGIETRQIDLQDTHFIESANFYE